MRLSLALASYAVICACPANAWHASEQTNLLQQREAVAELTAPPDRPGAFLRYSCSVFSGPQLQIGFGPLGFEAFTKFSADRASATPETVSIRLETAPPQTVLDVVAEPDAAAGTQEIYTAKGTDAGRAAEALASAQSIIVTVGGQVLRWPNAPSPEPLKQALAQCPFR
ncbi:MAG TPA: hypothetical protein DCL54_04390 [Alphaproteobacteria bacterium]|nr:hypothetical protein [Alphaproteobacteria bacterium]HAJ45803.1 hypothetical protein [Alphaproteobacteria bacterium]